MSDPVLVAFITSGGILLASAVKGAWSLAQALAKAQAYKDEAEKTIEAKNAEIGALKNELLEVRRGMPVRRERERGR